MLKGVHLETEDKRQKDLLNKDVVEQVKRLVVEQIDLESKAEN